EAVHLVLRAGDVQGSPGTEAVLTRSAAHGWLSPSRRHLGCILPQVSWRAGRVEHVLASAAKPVDVVVLDPPRKGAGKAVVESIAAGSPDRVVYVACDPAALARDLAFFAAHGYSLTDLRAFDAFPMTHHVECVALLS
ncbi:MAG TPA: class I SAM-dependent RNA methyltransferase, partial [Amycolatopsis sp.]|nr:class I SAM-dependent RNA methyltransferase [Amycolatopsis sp.]